MTTMNYLTLIIGIVFPVISAYIVKWLMNLLKKASATVDNLNPAIKQVIVIAISALLSFVFGFFGIVPTGGTTLALLNSVDVQTILTAALAMIFHNGDKLSNINVAMARSTSGSGYRGINDKPGSDARNPSGRDL